MSTDPAANPAPTDTPNPNPDQYNWAPFIRGSLLSAALGIAIFVVAGVANLSSASPGEETENAEARFMTAYLTGYVFWFSLPVGGLALLMIGYLAKTSWGLLLRRPLEAATRTLPLFFVLWLVVAVVLLAHGPSPYWWTHAEDAHAPAAKAKTHEEADANAKGEPNKRIHAEELGKLQMQKRINEQVEEEQQYRRDGTFGFLSPPAFLIVGLVLFAIWGFMILVLNKWGAAAHGDRTNVGGYLDKLNKFSGPGLIVWALTITVCATQWVMSLEPSWSSTMFPVIFAVNSFLTCFACCLALFLLLVSRPPFKQLMRPKFQIDMGTLMLAFTLFWSYTSFSQFMLVWIGNLPEEIPFYLKRSSHTEWWYVSLALCVFHFAVPFLLLLFRDIKMHPTRLRAVAIYLVVICAIDVTWWIEPSLANPRGFPIFLMDIGAVMGIGGLWGFFFFNILKKRPLFPADQAYQLPEGHHEHH